MSSDRHRERGITFRPPGELRLPVEAILGKKGFDVTQTNFFIACMNALVSDPVAFLTVLKPHWPKDAKEPALPRITTERDAT